MLIPQEDDIRLISCFLFRLQKGMNIPHHSLQQMRLRHGIPCLSSHGGADIFLPGSGDLKSKRDPGGLRNTVLGSDRRKRNVFKAHGVISVTPFALPSVHGLG